MRATTPPGVYVEAFEDRMGEPLDGSHTYCLRLPAGVPATELWSVVAFGEEEALLVGPQPAVRLDVRAPLDVERNDDGSVDLYFAPRAPAGREANWISTVEGWPFCVLYRHDAARPSATVEASPWILDHIVRLE
jgi:hypothetical protein